MAVAKTRMGMGAYGARRPGSFANKAATAATEVNKKFVYRRHKRLRARKRNV